MRPAEITPLVKEGREFKTRVDVPGMGWIVSTQEFESTLFEGHLPKWETIVFRASYNRHLGDSNPLWLGEFGPSLVQLECTFDQEFAYSRHAEIVYDLAVGNWEKVKAMDIGGFDRSAS